MSTLKEISSIKALRDESDKVQNNNFSSVPIEISSWNGYPSFFSQKIRSKFKSMCPRKLPVLKNLKQSISYSISPKKSTFKQNERVYTVNSPYQLYPISPNKLPYSFQNIVKHPSSKSFAVQAITPGPYISKEVNQLLHNPLIPKRDISPFRLELSKAINTSRTIEELLKRTKLINTIPRYSLQTKTEKIIWPSNLTHKRIN